MRDANAIFSSTPMIQAASVLKKRASNLEIILNMEITARKNQKIAYNKKTGNQTVKNVQITSGIMTALACLDSSK